MTYIDDFERSFMDHTLKIVKDYSGPYDATILVNCLLGLLVVPKETSLGMLPEDPLCDLEKWGITPSSIKSPGRKTKNGPDPDTIKGLVYNLRHAVAHFRIAPVPRTKKVHSFEFENDLGLKAEIRIDEMRDFVTKLAEHLRVM